MNNFTKSIVYSGVVLAAGLVAIFAIYNNMTEEGANFSSIEPAAGQVGEAFTDTYDGVAGSIKKAATGVTEAAGNAATAATDATTDAVKTAADATTGAVDAAKTMASDAVEAATPDVDVSGTIEAAKDAMTGTDAATSATDAATDAVKEKATDMATDAAVDAVKTEPAAGLEDKIKGMMDQ